MNVGRVVRTMVLSLILGLGVGYTATRPSVKAFARQQQAKLGKALLANLNSEIDYVCHKDLPEARARLFDLQATVAPAHEIDVAEMRVNTHALRCNDLLMELEEAKVALKAENRDAGQQIQ